MNIAAPVRSALFVDFDNVYIGLKKLDSAAAERFAKNPQRWLAWLQTYMVEGGAAPVDSSAAHAISTRLRSGVSERITPAPGSALSTAQH